LFGLGKVQKKPGGSAGKETHARRDPYPPVDERERVAYALHGGAKAARATAAHAECACGPIGDAGDEEVAVGDANRLRKWRRTAGTWNLRRSRNPARFLPQNPSLTQLKLKFQSWARWRDGQWNGQVTAMSNKVRRHGRTQFGSNRDHSFYRSNFETET